jgi:hypothetical protein
VSVPPAQSQQAGFQRAIESDRQGALVELLCSDAPAVPRAPLIALIDRLYAMLRSPIYPRRAGRTASVATLVAASARQLPVPLRAVLASETAENEVVGVLELVDTIARYVPARLELLLVRWDYLDEPSDAESFGRIVDVVEARVERAGWPPGVVDVAHVRGDPSCPDRISSPLDFAVASREVRRAARRPDNANPRLTRDLAWVLAFYERQRSLSRHGERQPLYDLAIRRAIGRRLSAPAAGRLNPLLVTSELHGRLLPCYAASFPILNVDVRAHHPDPNHDYGILAPALCRPSGPRGSDGCWV